MRANSTYRAERRQRTKARKLLAVWREQAQERNEREYERRNWGRKYTPPRARPRKTYKPNGPRECARRRGDLARAKWLRALQSDVWEVGY